MRAGPEAELASAADSAHEAWLRASSLAAAAGWTLLDAGRALVIAAAQKWVGGAAVEGRPLPAAVQSMCVHLRMRPAGVGRATLRHTPPAITRTAPTSHHIQV